MYARDLLGIQRRSYLGESITDSDALKRHLEIGQIIEDTKLGMPGLQMNDVASIKSYCDAYFLLRAAIVIRDSVYKNKKQGNSRGLLIEEAKAKHTVG